ncbi:hypothetical protein [Rhizobium laguerreae]|jgi:hypothetical protein|uniref:hypothetical protein n=1 Tax=Rhizobium laguerreae TaxID=1076926 RepID=UPI001C90984E|nr:hypothetical protein [Rhizobium laguerreae]MBY3211497.1 hypothetical protein [Rhizobium laguerreae]
MDIETFEAPRAGRVFRYILRDGSQLLRSRAFVNGQLVYSSDCPDPPCHEEFIVPPNAAGEMLQVMGEDSRGQTISRDFLILGENSSNSGGFSAAG